MATIDERYIEKFPSSATMYEKAVGYFPSGITHQNRFATPFPVYFNRASGGVKFDLDGSETIDFVMGNGALLQGHAHPEIVAAVTSQVAQGTHLGGNTPFEMEWADAIMRLVPSVEQVRFTNSGTESTYLAIRLARAFNAKSKILKFEEHFHGWHEYALPSQGNAPPASVPQAILDMVIVVRPNIDEVEEVLKNDPDVGVVILEPTGAHYSCFPIQPDPFLQQLREVTAKYSVVLIFDETITGFRISKGGAQVRYNVEPDLTTFGKIVAGGMPGAAIGGKAEIMEMMSFRGTPDWDDHRRIGQGGTFNANPPTAVAGIVGLKMIAEQPINERADAMASRLKSGLNEAFQRAEAPGFAYGIASLVNPILGLEPTNDYEAPVITYEERRAAMTGKRTGFLTKAMLNHGVHVMGGQVFMVSSAHTEEQIDRTVEAFEASLRDLRAEGIV
ncbi:MAG: aminotransferase class III-fold pyridoxal phosphate-dependent enzyme [Chloroflexi bacterium]|nr:aminotransferase class III-fold pyridoxal phosphate-dependent enzyme [Chloroflexota bacterium]